MTPGRPVGQEAAFVDAAGGPRLRIVTQPAKGHCLGTVIWVHAFAEEMNKTRRMSARMARLFAGGGWRVMAFPFSRAENGERLYVPGMFRSYSY